MGASQGFNNSGFNVYTGAPQTLAFNVDSTGLVTQPKQSCFLATLAAESNITGNTTVGYVGAAAATTIVFQRGSSYFAGNGSGTPASYTAPVTGFYQFMFFPSVSFGITGGLQWELQLVVTGTSSATYFIVNLPSPNQLINFSGVGGDLVVGSSISIVMTATDVAKFGFASVGGSKVDGTTGGFVSGILLA